jgi:biopolymer transport protein ExbB
MFDMQRSLSRWLAAALAAAALVLGAAAHAQAPAQPAATAPAVAQPVASAGIQPPAAPADNPYGLRALWEQGDLVAKATLVILVIMSIGSWYVLITKLVEQHKLGVQARDAHKAFSGAETVRKAADNLKAGSPYRYIVDYALESAKKYESVQAQVDLNNWLSQSIERALATVQSRTQDGLAVLATVGSTAPFVGLFGTVWGIYNALVKIGASGQASIDRVAGPVGEALIMTAIGLAVAVPAVLGYNWLVRRNKVAMDTVRAFGSDLHTVLLAATPPRRPLP